MKKGLILYLNLIKQIFFFLTPRKFSEPNLKYYFTNRNCIFPNTQNLPRILLG